MALYRYLGFNKTLGYSHEIEIDRFYGYNRMTPSKKPIPMNKLLDKTVNVDGIPCVFVLTFYEDTVYNKSLEQLAKEKAEKEVAVV